MKTKIIALLSAAALLAPSAAALTVPEGTWYTQAVTKAVQNGWIGYENDTFVSEQIVSVAEVNQAIRIYASKIGYPSENLSLLAVDSDIPATREYVSLWLAELLSHEDSDPEYLSEVNYLPDIGNFYAYKNAVFSLYRLGILCGTDETGRFGANDPITKEECAVIVYRTLNPSARVKNTLPSGVSVNDAFAAFGGEKTERDLAPYVVANDGFVISQAFYDFIETVGGGSTEEENLNVALAAAAVEAQLHSTDFRVSPASFDELKALYEKDYASDKVIIEQNDMPVTAYAYYQNYILSNFSDAVFTEFMLEKMPDSSTIYKLYGSNYVLAKHILIQYGEGEEGKKAAFDKITDIKKQLDEGADFDTLMAQYGEDPGMKQTPGGYCFTRGEMVESFENAAFALADNERSDIVESDFGYHIIWRLPLTEEIFCENTDLCNTLSYYTALGEWNELNSIIYETVTLSEPQ